MSGGSFNYAYSRMQEFADELNEKLDAEPQDRYPLAPAVQSKLREIAAQAERVAKLAKEAEWLYSGDTGEDTFMRRVTEIEEPRGVDIEV